VTLCQNAVSRDPTARSCNNPSRWHDARVTGTARIARQDVEDESGAWVHAYLHRKEGDASNAAYWYRRAGQPVAGGSLEGEWKAIATALLSRTGA
jgi:hypothetical protein